MPASIAMRIPITRVSVKRAVTEAGSLKAITPLLTASTPVIAVQPLANARSSSQMPRASVAAPRWGGATTGMGCPPAASVLMTPRAIIASKQKMNKYVGARKMPPVALTPRRFTSVTIIRIARHSASVCFSSAGTAEIKAPTPAEMPTAAVRT